MPIHITVSLRQVLFDLLALFGVRTLDISEEAEEGVTHNTVLQPLIDCLDLQEHPLDLVAVACQVGVVVLVPSPCTTGNLVLEIFGVEFVVHPTTKRPPPCLFRCSVFEKPF